MCFSFLSPVYVVDPIVIAVCGCLHISLGPLLIILGFVCFYLLCIKMLAERDHRHLMLRIVMTISLSCYVIHLAFQH